MKNKFLTITKNGTNEIIIKKSKFITNIARVETEEEAKEFLAAVCEEHKKATHNCFAYLIGQTDQIQRESDNGEPSGTAGVPILEALRKNEVHNTAVVVTRYFGGIKLGAGGLIRAYSNSASQAVETVGIVEKVLQTKINITVPYKLNDSLQYYLNENNFVISNISYGAAVTIETATNSENVTNFVAELNNQLAGKGEIIIGEEEYIEIPYQPKKEAE